MRLHALAMVLVSVVLLGCLGDPDYVATPYPTSCRIGSILARRGIPENLQDILSTNSCRVVRTPNMQGPDYTAWLAGFRTQEKNCNSPITPLWTEEALDGTIIAVNFCEGLCATLRAQLKRQTELDPVCAGTGANSGVGGAGAP